MKVLNQSRFKINKKPINELSIQIGKRLAGRRGELQLSMRELKGVPSGSYSHVENGQCRVTVEKLIKICKSLDISVSDLLKGL